ncbi:hypothetical protein LUZ60_000095 [Juncus effusus]|nr:hypothetical protein LUZ60_000095 [Juncus effusus]
MMGDFSSDITIEILHRVPAKFIPKLKIVCKLWKSIITDPIFIDSHLQFNTSNSPQILLFSPQNSVRIIDSKSWSISHELKLVRKKNWTKTTCFGGSCDGLICLYDLKTGFADVINPATKEKINLINPSLNPKWDYSTSSFCLGFDPLKKIYKVVRFCWINDQNGCIFEVCNVNCGDISWRQIEGKFRVSFISTGVYFNGVLYWLAQSDINAKICLFLFDLKEEKISIFDETKCDILINIGNYNNIQLVQLAGRFALVTGTENLMNIFIMGGNVNNWQHKYQIRVPNESIMRPVFITGRKILMRDFSFKELKYYDLERDLFESCLAIIDDENWCCAHVESLVMLNCSKF